MTGKGKAMGSIGSSITLFPPPSTRLLDEDSNAVRPNRRWSSFPGNIFIRPIVQRSSRDLKTLSLQLPPENALHHCRETASNSTYMPVMNSNKIQTALSDSQKCGEFFVYQKDEYQFDEKAETVTKHTTTRTFYTPTATPQILNPATAQSRSTIHQGTAFNLRARGKAQSIRISTALSTIKNSSTNNSHHSASSLTPPASANTWSSAERTCYSPVSNISVHQKSLPALPDKPLPALPEERSLSKFSRKALSLISLSKENSSSLKKVRDNIKARNDELSLSKTAPDEKFAINYEDLYALFQIKKESYNQENRILCIEEEGEKIKLSWEKDEDLARSKQNNTFNQLMFIFEQCAKSDADLKIFFNTMQGKYLNERGFSTALGDFIESANNPTPPVTAARPQSTASKTGETEIVAKRLSEFAPSYKKTSIYDRIRIVNKRIRTFMLNT